MGVGKDATVLGLGVGARTGFTQKKQVTVKFKGQRKVQGLSVCSALVSDLSVGDYN